MVEEKKIERVWNILNPVDRLQSIDIPDLPQSQMTDDQRIKISELIKQNEEIRMANNEYDNFWYHLDQENLKYHHMFHDKGKIGSFFKGFFGYNSNPNYIEFFLWLFFLIFGVKKWADFYYIADPKK